MACARETLAVTSVPSFWTQPAWLTCDRVVTPATSETCARDVDGPTMAVMSTRPRAFGDAGSGAVATASATAGKTLRRG